MAWMPVDGAANDDEMNSAEATIGINDATIMVEAEIRISEILLVSRNAKRGSR